MLDRHTDLKKHWCPLSESYTGCDSLIAAINNGWRLMKTATITQHTIGDRSINVYTFMLAYDAMIHTMRVVETPYLHRVIEMYKIAVFEPEKMPNLRSSRFDDHAEMTVEGEIERLKLAMR